MNAILTLLLALSSPNVFAQVQKNCEGYDLLGNKKTCTSSQTQACTMSMDEGDYFAVECRKAGGVACMCDCHQYLCSRPIQHKFGGPGGAADRPEANPSPTPASDLEGVPVSCPPTGVCKAIKPQPTPAHH